MPSPGRVSRRARRLVDRHAFDERADDARIADGAGAAVEQVAVEDRQVGELADLERAGVSSRWFT